MENLPINMPVQDDLTVWTSYETVYDNNGSSTGYKITYNHAPILAFYPVFIVCLIVLYYIVKELLKRLKNL